MPHPVEAVIIFRRRSLGILQSVAPPTFSLPAGQYLSNQSITIATLTIGATIRYTTNGSTPSRTNGIIYLSPINITANSTIRAIAYKLNSVDSMITSAIYKIAPATSIPLNDSGMTQLSPNSQLRLKVNRINYGILNTLQHRGIIVYQIVGTTMLITNLSQQLITIPYDVENNMNHH